MNKIKLEVNPASFCDPSLSCKGLTPGGKMPEEEIREAAQTTIQEALYLDQYYKVYHST